MTRDSRAADGDLDGYGRNVDGASANGVTHVDHKEYSAGEVAGRWIRSQQVGQRLREHAAKCRDIGLIVTSMHLLDLACEIEANQ